MNFPNFGSVVFPESWTKYGGGANHRKGLKVEAVYETGVPPEARFHYHHEMEYLRTSYKSISFCCYKAIEDKNDPLRGAMGLGIGKADNRLPISYF